MMNRFVVFLFVFSVLFPQYVSAEKIIVSQVGFQTEGLVGIDIYKSGESVDIGFGLKSSEALNKTLWKAIVVPDDRIVKKVKVYVRANSSKRMMITLACIDVKNNVGYFIASRTISTLLGDGIQEIALDMIESGHVTNPNKYEYIFHIKFMDGGDDGNLMFYGAKIKLKP